MTPVRFIAEVSSNHAQDLGRCLEFVDAAADCGCDAVKFQLFKVSEIFAPEILEKSEEHRAREAWELPEAFLPHIAERCQRRGIEFSCTPFSLEAVEALEPYVNFYKIASYELLWADLLKACAQTGKPVILSTGMATLDEIAHAVDILKEAGATDITLLHCVSAYPTPVEEANLSAINTIADKTNCAVGWSDHTVSPAVIFRAIHKWGAPVIEFHLDLDAAGAEYNAGHCWLPDEIGPVVGEVKRGFLADGNGQKAPTPSELDDREWRADPDDGLRPLRHIRADWRDAS